MALVQWCARASCSRAWQFGIGPAMNGARETPREGRRGPVRCGAVGDTASNRHAGSSAVDLARDVLKSFRGLRKFIAAIGGGFAPYPDRGGAVRRVAGRGRNLAAAAHRVAQSGPVSGKPRATCDFLSAKLRDLEHEVFCCLYLDKRHRLIEYEELFRGTIDGASVHPREIVKLALQRNSAAVIVAHNHPSGVAEPSQADELVTQRLKEALGLVDIRLLDHIIVGDGASVSFAERGLL